MRKLTFPFIFCREKLLGYLLEKYFPNKPVLELCLASPQVPAQQLQDRFVWEIFLCRRRQGHQEKTGRRFPALGYCGKFNDLSNEWQSDSQAHTSCFQPSWFVLWAFGLSFQLSLLCVLLCFDPHLPNTGPSVTAPPSSSRSKAACSSVLLSALEGLSFHYSQAPAASGLPPPGFRGVLSLPSAGPFVICPIRGSTYSYTSNITACSHQLPLGFSLKCARIILKSVPPRSYFRMAQFQVHWPGKCHKNGKFSPMPLAWT